MRVNRLAIVGALFLTSLLMAQQALDNAAVVKMAKAGLGDDVIV